MIKVMIVDDSAYIRSLIMYLLSSNEEKKYKVVISAKDGNDALCKMENEEIDVILMDIQMPKKNGLETLKEIMKNKPMPIIMFSSLTKEGAEKTIECLANGAVDYITKPENEKDVEKLKEEIFSKIDIAVKELNQKRIYKPKELKMIEKEHFLKEEDSENIKNLILIGSSTGGPESLKIILSQVPKELNACILIAQHMGMEFTSSLAEYLNNFCNFQVKEAEDGEELKPGVVLISPGETNMEIYRRQGKLHAVLSRKEDKQDKLKPSVNKLFNSVGRLENINSKVIAIVLTGMGDDGANGTEAIKRIQGTVFIENEETSMIYGMPKKVKERNTVDYELPNNEIMKKALTVCKK